MDTGNQSTELCKVVSLSGPNQEPLACGYPIGHEGNHAWASLPTFGGRHRFTSDDDGHRYLIPADKKVAFNAWLEHQGRMWASGLSDEEFEKVKAEYSGEDFESYMIDGGVGSYTFENPQRDK